MTGVSCAVCSVSPCFVHCVWCGVDCEDDAPVHVADCPQSTGVYPADTDEYCCHCSEPCGDVYALIPDGDWSQVVCLPCKVLAP